MARWSRLLFIAVTLCALNGCVYLRLFSVKQQCADFDNNFDFAPGPGLTLVFKHPVLLAEDTATLIGGPPSEITAPTTADADEHWIFRYRRPHPQEKPAAAEVVALDFAILDGKIERVSFPPQVFAIIPVDLAKAMMRAMGHARVDQSARTATTQVDLDPGLAPAPDREGIEKLFGKPDQVLGKDDSERRLFRYQLDPPASSGLKPGSATAAAVAGPTAMIGIVFRNGVAPAQQFQAGVSGLWLYLELPGAVPAPTKPQPKPVPEPDYGTANGG